MEYCFIFCLIKYSQVETVHLISEVHIMCFFGLFSSSEDKISERERKWREEELEEEYDEIDGIEDADY